MEMVLTAELNAICIAILSLIMVANWKSEKEEKKSNYFTIVLISQCIFFAMDFFWTFTDGSVKLPINLNYLLDSVYFTISGIGAYFWILYSEVLLGTNFFKKKSTKIIFLVPVIALIFFSVTARWNHLLFFVDENNVYHRGILYPLHPIISFGYLAFASLRALYEGFREKVKANRAKDFALAFFAIPPVIALCIEVFLDGLPMVCAGITISLLFLFLTVQRETNENQLRIIDALTGDYESITLVDLSNGKMHDYRLNSMLREIDDISAHTRDYTERITKLAETIVYPEDKDEFYAKMSIHNIIYNLEKNPDYIIETRLASISGPLFYQIKVVAGENFKNTKFAILGLRNVDELTKKDIQQRILLEDARTKAEAANEAKSKFLFNMSHDIRTPMNAILGFTALAKRHSDEEVAVEKYLEKIETSSQHLLKLINDILEMSSIENEKVFIEEVPAKVHECGDAVNIMAAAIAKKKGIEFSLKYGKIKNEDVLADRTHIHQIILNLMSNALKYTDKGGRIDVTICQKPSFNPGYGNYEFEVSDTGIGMSEEFLKHIFENFERERSTALSGIEGTGLGMPITKKLVELMDGTIDIKSKPGVGTTVVVALPLKLDGQSNKKDGSKNDEYEIRDLRDRRVLVVENNDESREITSQILKEEGVFVDEAHDGIEAVEKLKNSDPGDYDLILMDTEMPNLDGYEATKIIRNLSRKALTTIPIIAMKNNAFEDDDKKEISCGMNAHLTKPLDVETLLDTVEKYSKKF